MHVQKYVRMSIKLFDLAMCISMRVDMCTGMHADMCGGMHIDICIDTCIDMCTDMWYRHVGVPRDLSSLPHLVSLSR